MDQGFYDVYEDMYEDFSALRATDPKLLSPILNVLTPQQTRSMISQAKSAIENAERDLSVQLRPDAKYFLLLNFTEMILLPISGVRERPHTTPLISSEQMQQHLKADIALIVSEAKLKSQLPTWDTKSAEITGHNVIDAVSAAWNRMKFNEYFYWASK